MAQNKNKREETSADINFPGWGWLHRYAFWLVILMTLVGFGMRVYRIGYLSFWFDEYAHVMAVRDYIKQGSNLIGADLNGILLTLFITPLFQIFGMSEFWARLPSAICGAATIPLTYLLSKKLFNRYIGLLAAFLLTASFYHTFWSRIARMYATFGCFFTLLLLIFYQAYERPPLRDKFKSFYKKYGLHKKYFILLPFIFVLALLSHQLAYFFVFGLGLYGSIIGIQVILHKDRDNLYYNKYSILLYPTLLGGLLLMPFSEDVIRYLLELFLRERMVNVVIPDWEFIMNKLTSAQRFKAFGNYWEVVSTDYPYLCYLAPIGVVTAFFHRKKSGIFLASFYVFIIFLISFIFRKRTESRYFLFLHPLYLISVAVAIYYILRYTFPAFLPRKFLRSKIVKTLLLIGLGRLVLFVAPMSDMQSMITTQHHGRVVPKEIASWFFTNWRYPCTYVKKRKNPDDIIMCTVPKAAKFYVDINNPIWFRQRKYDTKKEKYVFREPPKDKKFHATTYKGFVNTIRNTSRGWLLADYYLYNAMTDPRARQFAFKNLRYHYYATNDGSVKVFSWDHSTPQPPSKQFVVDIGKTGQTSASKELDINIPNYQQAKGYKFVIDGQNFDRKEALIVINKENAKYLPAMDSRKREEVSIRVPKKWLNPKNNKIQFQYRKKKIQNPRYFEAGFAVYNVKPVPL